MFHYGGRGCTEPSSGVCESVEWESTGTPPKFLGVPQPSKSRCPQPAHLLPLLAPKHCLPRWTPEKKSDRSRQMNTAPWLGCKGGLSPLPKQAPTWLCKVQQRSESFKLTRPLGEPFPSRPPQFFPGRVPTMHQTWRQLLAGATSWRVFTFTHGHLHLSHFAQVQEQKGPRRDEIMMFLQQNEQDVRPLMEEGSPLEKILRAAPSPHMYFSPSVSEASPVSLQPSFPLDEWLRGD
nr:uncharacterized protein LOC132598386 [Globicephala melas]